MDRFNHIGKDNEVRGRFKVLFNFDALFFTLLIYGRGILEQGREKTKGKYERKKKHNKICT